jgi:hypothetical protein
MKIERRRRKVKESQKREKDHQGLENRKTRFSNLFTATPF